MFNVWFPGKFVIYPNTEALANISTGQKNVFALDNTESDHGLEVLPVLPVSSMHLGDGQCQLTTHPDMLKLLSGEDRQQRGRSRKYL